MHIDSHFDSGNIEVVELLDNNIANLRIKKMWAINTCIGFTFVSMAPRTRASPRQGRPPRGEPRRLAAQLGDLEITAN